MRYEVHESPSVDGAEKISFFVWDNIAEETSGTWSHNREDVDKQVKALNIEYIAEIDPSVTTRSFEIDDESPGRDDEWRAYWDQSRSGTPTTLVVALRPKIVLSWADLAAANDAETMEEIALIGPGEFTILGQCDEIRRVQ